MALTTLQPTANETPDSGQGGLAVTTPSNTGHAATTSACIDAGGQTIKTCRWFTIPNQVGQRLSATLKFDHTSNGALNAPGAGNFFSVEYSVNNGGAWTTAASRTDFTSSSGPTTVSVTLSATQDISQVQVRDNITVFTTDDGESASATVTIANIKVEVTTVDAGVIGIF